MTIDRSQQALRPVQIAPGVLVHPTADRRLAVEHWLLADLNAQGRDRARVEWRQFGVAMLPLGVRFSAVRLPGDLVLAAACSSWNPAEVDQFLAEALDGGPVVCDPRHHRYYALVPGSMPRTWRQAAEDWREMDVDCLGSGTILGIPPLYRDEFNPTAVASYWSVPMPSAATLCKPLSVARLIAAGRHQMAEGLDV
ncbi:hypothetical protein ACWCPI_00715 [Streptomyces sp. NPDC001920]